MSWLWSSHIQGEWNNSFIKNVPKKLRERLPHLESTIYGSYTMMAQPMKTRESHYPMIQFLNKFDYVWIEDIPAIDLCLKSSHKFVKLISLDGYHADLESIPKINLQVWLYITRICTPRTIPWNVIQPTAKGLEPRPTKWWWRHGFVGNDTNFDAKWIETSYNKTNLNFLININNQRYATTL